MADYEKKVKKLAVSTPQGESGVLSRESQFVFNYATEDRNREISLGMPLRTSSYLSNQLHPIFAMNLPEGRLREKIKERFSKQFAKMDDMAMLSITGSDQIGRLRLNEAGSINSSKNKPQIGLKEILTARSSDRLFDFLIDTYLSSGISGVQPKVLVPDADEIRNESNLGRMSFRTPNLIVKSSSEAYPDLAQNEFLCMDAARIAGIKVPEFHLSEDGALFVMKRFDRIFDGEKEIWLGFEDMTVLAGQNYDDYGNYKYQGSYEGVLRLIANHCGTHSAESQQRFFEYVAATCLMGNGDAHLKNFGLLYESPNKPETIRLSPMYDVVNTKIYSYINRTTGETVKDDELALKLNRSRKYPEKSVLLAFGKECGVVNPNLVIEKIQDAMSESISINKDKVSKELLCRMQKDWDENRLRCDLPTV